jgi:flagellar assembly protein FliH
MLSKVVRQTEAAAVQVLVFPHLGENAPAKQQSAVITTPQMDDRERLLERVRSLEALVTAEARKAFEAGRQEGEKAARAEVQPVLQRLAASISETIGMRADLRRRAESDVVQLSLLIARRILHRQIAVDEAALTALARVTLERLTRAESYRITVHPQFASSISAAIPSGQASRVQIEPDPTCAPGTLIIHSSEGTIDASIDAQLEEIGRGLADRVGAA